MKGTICFCIGVLNTEEDRPLGGSRIMINVERIWPSSP